MLVLSRLVASPRGGLCARAALTGQSLSGAGRFHGLGAAAATTATTAKGRQETSIHTSAVQRMSGSDHVRLWTAERLVSLGQIPAFIGPLVVTTPLTDAIFCTALVLHSHWG